ncbi:hypothetical protein [Chromobacterium alticapitis]|uniref:Uncharacterized protein n=1 Tax=Chromobacterium alticapitis TaxID=2073169 RepID=A0A2S5DD23_9NEIS|nr:hypothetical protein [Chromobacterium alticapitis]POZ60867.1 hypothetical protein C2I19_16380 [Chromobacterium alticapitis]
MKFILPSIIALIIGGSAFAATPDKPLIAGHILRLDSACDFSSSAVRIQRDAVRLEASLKPDAAARLKQAARDYEGQPVVIVVNDIPISASPMASVQMGDKAQFNVGTDAAPKVLPTLLETTCHQIRPQPK